MHFFCYLLYLRVSFPPSCHLSLTLMKSKVWKLSAEYVSPVSSWIQTFPSRRFSPTPFPHRRTFLHPHHLRTPRRHPSFAKRHCQVNTKVRSLEASHSHSVSTNSTVISNGPSFYPRKPLSSSPPTTPPPPPHPTQTLYAKRGKISKALLPSLARRSPLIAPRQVTRSSSPSRSS